MAGARKALPLIDPTRCTGCGWCVAVCPPHVLSLQAEAGIKCSVLHDAAACTGCALCAVQCPFDAIAMERPGKGSHHLITDPEPGQTP